MPSLRPAHAATVALAAATSLLLSGCDPLDGSGGRAVPAQPVLVPNTAPIAATPSWTPSSTPTPTPTPIPTPTPKPTPKPLMQQGDSGRQVRELQVRLDRENVFPHGATGYFGPNTKKSVKRFQEARGLPVTGSVDKKTWERLVARTGKVTSADLYPKPAGPSDSTLHAKCLTGRAVCIDKSTRTLRWVVDGEVQYWMSARFGAASSPTDEGVFSIAWKDRDHISSIYESAMPFSMFFSGGQAIHYSSNFAATGYNGASHGCVNVRDWNLAERLYEDTRVGDRVVVYWS